MGGFAYGFGFGAKRRRRRAPEPTNLIAPEILSLAYYNELAALDIGEWSHANSYEVKISTDEGSPITLLDWTATTGDYLWNLPQVSVGKSLVLSVRATGAGGTTTATSASFGPVQPLDVLYPDLSTSPFGSTPLNNRTFSHTVSPGQNRKLIVYAALSAAGSETFTSCTYNGVSLGSPVKGNAIKIDGSDRAVAAVWMMDNPPVGTANIVVTRSGTMTTRFYARGIGVQDCAVSIVDSDDDFQTTDSTTMTDGTPSVATDIYQRNITFALTYLNYHADTVTPDPMWTAIGTKMWASGAALNVDSMTRVASGAGAMPYSETISAAARFAYFISLILQPVAHISAPPVYYFGNSGNDTTGDGSQGNPWKSLDKIEALSPLAAGTEIVLEDGEYHRFASRPAYGAFALDLVANGSAAGHVKIRSRSGGTAYVAGDEVMTGWSAASAGETNSVAAAAGAEKKTLGAFSSYRQLSAPCIDGKMLQPCSWSATGFPTSTHDWDLQTPGSDSFTFVASADVQDGSTPQAAYQSGKSVQCKSVAITNGYRWTVRITDAAIGTHYGSTSPVGALAQFKTANTQTKVTAITAYDQTGSWIEIEYDVTGTVADKSGTSTTNFYWNIICHPFDLRQTGQFARVGNDVFAIWQAGTTKSVMACNRVMRVQGTYAEMSNIEVCRAADDPGGTDQDSILEIAGSQHTFTNVRVSQGINPSRPPAFGNNASTLSNSTFGSCSTREVRHHSGFRLNKVAGGVAISSPDLQELGRSALYAAGSSPGSYGITVTDALVLDHAPVHGNGATSYQQSHGNIFSGIIITGASNAWTSQVDTAHVRPPGKTNLLEKFCMLASRPIGAAPQTPWANTQLIRIDNGDTDSIYRDGMAAYAYQTAMFFGIGTGGALPNTGASLNRLALQSLKFEAGAGTGMSVTDVLTASGDAATTWSGTGGATVTNSDMDSGESVYPLSDPMWEKLTRNGSGGHVAKQIGPSSIAMTVPAYGTSFAMVDLLVISPVLRGTWQEGRAVGIIWRMSPLTTGVTLPSGVGDNDSFEIDQFWLVPKVVLAGGTYSVTLREANTSASNGPTRDTVVAITVV